jgi:hypothetical protein
MPTITGIFNNKMKMKKMLKYSLFVALFFVLSCKQKETTHDFVPLPSVSVIHPIRGDIQEQKQINGQVVYLNKNTITAPISGYVTSVTTTMGDWVNKSDLLFKIQTKENKALQKSKVSIPNQPGIVSVFAGTSGYISSLDITGSGVFISEGNAMATIVKNTDLVIQVNAPYEYSKLLINNKIIEIELADKEVLSATFYKSIPIVDPISQTQQIFFKLNKHHTLPENLNVMVTFLRKEKKNGLMLPKDAILTNETQDEFWVMKMTNDSLAVKVPIEKGLEDNGRIEILKPTLQLTDKIIQKGAYGLADSTKVKLN